VLPLNGLYVLRPNVPYFIIINFTLSIMPDYSTHVYLQMILLDPQEESTQRVNRPFPRPFEWNFDLDKSGQKFHHSLKEHHKISNTVEPLLSGPPLSGHPLLNSHISKSRNFCNTNTINYPSIKRPPLLSGRGHPKSGPKLCFMSIFTSIKRPACRI
jgi:hypothetical protein